MAIDYTTHVPGVNAAREIIAKDLTAFAQTNGQTASKAILDGMQEAAITAEATSNAALEELFTFYIKNVGGSPITLVADGTDWVFAAGATYAVEPRLGAFFLKEATKLEFTDIQKVLNAEYQLTGVVETFLG